MPCSFWVQHKRNSSGEKCLHPVHKIQEPQAASSRAEQGGLASSYVHFYNMVFPMRLTIRRIILWASRHPLQFIAMMES